MLSTSIPVKFGVPFANAGTKNTIPDAASPTPGLASNTTGFPPLTFTPLASGGIPPAGADFNGILYQITTIEQWVNAGGMFRFDSAFATTIGGYPKGAQLMSSNLDIVWLSTVENNTTDPDNIAVAAGWSASEAVGATAITGLTNANVTLTAIQAAKRTITLAGVLTANVQIIFPVSQGQTRVYNNTTGAFTVTCKTVAGTGSIVTQGGGEQYYGDGTNLVPMVVSTQAPGDNSQKPASTAFVTAAVAVGTPAASAADVKAGSSTTKPIPPASLLSALGFSAYFQSANQTITAAGGLTIAHGLTRKPILIHYILICLTAEGGYSVGDEANVTINDRTGQGVTIVPDATNLVIRYYSAASTFALVNKTTGATLDIVNANWAFVVRAWG